MKDFVDASGGWQKPGKRWLWCLFWPQTRFLALALGVSLATAADLVPGLRLLVVIGG
jgi:hypothetical protein